MPLVVLDDPFCALDKEVAKQARMTRLMSKNVSEHPIVSGDFLTPSCQHSG